MGLDVLSVSDLIDPTEPTSVQRALITGATGYIGSRLVEGLLAEGWQVHIVTRRSSSLNLLDEHLHRITIHVHDGSMDRMLKIVTDANPDVVYHLAAMTSSEHHWQDVDQMVNANILFSTQLVEAMFQSGAKHLVNTETFWQHGNDSDSFSPTCLYAATKQAFRDILIYYAGTGCIKAISLVLYDTYGPDDPRKKLLNFLRQAAQSEQQIDMTPGEQIIDITHVNDVVNAYLRAGEMLLSEKVGAVHTYAVTSGRRMMLKELVELIVRETGISVRPRWGGKPYRTNEVMVPWVGEPLPGWQPKVDLIAGIRDVFKDLG